MDNYPEFQMVKTTWGGYDLVVVTRLPNGNHLALRACDNPDYDTFKTKKEAQEWANANSGCIITWFNH